MVDEVPEVLVVAVESPEVLLLLLEYKGWLPPMQPRPRPCADCMADEHFDHPEACREEHPMIVELRELDVLEDAVVAHEVAVHHQILETMIQ